MQFMQITDTWPVYLAWVIYTYPFVFARPCSFHAYIINLKCCITAHSKLQCIITAHGRWNSHVNLFMPFCVGSFKTIIPKHARFIRIYISYGRIYQLLMTDAFLFNKCLKYFKCTKVPKVIFAFFNFKYFSSLKALLFQGSYIHVLLCWLM